MKPTIKQIDAGIEKLAYYHSKFNRSRPNSLEDETAYRSLIRLLYYLRTGKETFWASDFKGKIDKNDILTKEQKEKLWNDITNKYEKDNNWDSKPIIAKEGVVIE